MASLQVDGKEYEAVHVATGKSNVLLIRAGLITLLVTLAAA